MISVDNAFSVEAQDSVRKIAQSVQVAWKKEYQASITFFTIGTSTIGGNDIIPSEVGIESAWNRYAYADESDRVLSVGYERELRMPLGGLTKAQADIRLDNTSGRYTPGYAGGNSELFTSVLPRRPVIINAGFNYNGVDNTIPQFVGVTDKAVRLDMRSRTADLHATDFIGFLQNRYVDKTSMFTHDPTDVVMERALVDLGFATAQFELDPGLNTIKFGLFETGQRWGDLFDEMARAEYGHFYQDEEGVLRFENRHHWSNYPHYETQRIVTTSQVINSVMPTTDHLINVVEVKGSPREVKDTQLIWQTGGYAGAGVVALPPGDTELWANYNDPIFSVDTPEANDVLVAQTSFWIANAASDGTGTDLTSSVSLKSMTNFAQTSKLVFTNSYGSTLFLTVLDIWGRPARKTGDVYYRGMDSSSITAFEERPVVIENDYIQDATWAETLAELLLQDYASPENLQELSIRAMPELQMGDRISWQGRPWFVYGIRSRIDPSYGFIQDLKLLQREVVNFFRIGISTIGGGDKIAP